MRTNKLTAFLHGRTEMNDDDIRGRAPSVFATQPHEGASARYSFVPTTAVVGAMRDGGWMVVSAEEQRVRALSKTGYQKHLLRFQQREVKAVQGEYMPEITLTNSHDGTSTFQPGFALWRFTCSNGLMVSDASVSVRPIRHVGNAPAEVVLASNALFAELPKVCGQVDQFRGRILDQSEREAFARRAIGLRFESFEAAPIGEQAVLASRRREDVGDDLWRVLNRVQENFMRGGLRDRARRDEKGARFDRTRAITSLAVSMDFNRKLWDVAASFVNN